MTWLAVRPFNLATLDYCTLCGCEMLPGPIWSAETQSGVSFCCSRGHAVRIGIARRYGSMGPHLLLVMETMDISENEYVDAYHLRERLLSEEEIQSVLEKEDG